MKNFAIFSYGLDDPIKSLERLQSVQIHNLRSKPIAHGLVGARPPKILIGSQDIVGDARRHLLAHNVDPDRLPKGTNIVIEAILSATPEFFLSGTIEEREKRLIKWEQAQVEYAKYRFAQHMILSLVMHYDEECPHAHLLLIPLKLAPDKRRSDQTPNWRLDSDQLWKRAKLQDQQSDYAIAMSPFGLNRGAEGSDNKHEPYGNVMARVEADRAALALQARKIELREQEANDLLAKVLAREAHANRTQREAEEQRAEAAALKTRFELEAIDREDLIRRSNEVDRQSALLAGMMADTNVQQRLLSAEASKLDASRLEIERAYTTLLSDAVALEERKLETNDEAAKLAKDRHSLDQELRRVRQMDNGALVRRAYLLTQLEGANRQRDEARRVTRVTAIGRKELESDRLAFIAEKRDAEPALKRAAAFLEALGGLDKRHWDQPIDVRWALDAAKVVVREARVQDAERRERSVGIAGPVRARPGIKISAA